MASRGRRAPLKSRTRHHVPTRGLGHASDRGHPSSPLLHAEWIATPRRMHRVATDVALVRSALISGLATFQDGANGLGWVRPIGEEV
jgi:hypothetical protein